MLSLIYVAYEEVSPMPSRPGGFMKGEIKLTVQQHGVTLVFQGRLLGTDANASAILFIISSASSCV